MSQRAQRREQGPAVIPADWHRPAVLRLRASLQREHGAYWGLVAIAALASAPLGYWVGSLVGMLFPLLAEALRSGLPLPDWLANVLAPWGLASSVAGSLLSLGSGALMPALVIVWAVTAYNRQLALATRDILAGQAALMLIDDQYAKIVDEQRREHYRLNINPVSLGETFGDRLNFFAHHYPLFRHLALGPRELKIPTVIERNCWLEGVLTCLGGCLNTCGCVGACVTIPLLVRVVVTWSRQLAVKQAATDYLGGRHDVFLERLAADRERGRI